MSDSKQLSLEIQKSVNDPRPSVPHEDVMARMKARITRDSFAKAEEAKQGSMPPNRCGGGE